MVALIGGSLSAVDSSNSTVTICPIFNGSPRTVMANPPSLVSNSKPVNEMPGAEILTLAAEGTGTLEKRRGLRGSGIRSSGSTYMHLAENGTHWEVLDYATSGFELAIGRSIWPALCRSRSM